MEIAEDDEEENKRQSTVPEERPPAQEDTDAPPPTSPPPDQSTFPDAEESQATRERRGSEDQSAPHTVEEPRQSSQSARPELYSYTSHGSTGKPKVKLGPRPSLDAAGRPHTSGTSSHYRPVSTLPAGLKLFSRDSKTKKERPKSQYTPEPSMMASLPPIPDSPGQSIPPRPHTSGGRPSTSSGASIRPSIAISMNYPKSPTITPEKARLMKALELRKKQMSAAAPTTEHLSPTVNDGPDYGTIESHRASDGAPKEVHDTLAMLNDMAKEEESGMALDAQSVMKTDESDATRSDSYPVSPDGPSERAESTRASSVSESTDGTVQGRSSGKEILANDEPTSGAAPDESSTRQGPPDIFQNSASNNETSSIEEYPRLLPVAYQPDSSPSFVSQGNVKEPEPVPEQVQAETSADTKEIRSEIKDAFENDVPPSPPISAVDERGSLPQDLLQNTVEEPSSMPLAEPDPVPEPAVEVGVKEWKVPRSKFSVQDLRATSEAHSSPQEQLPPSTSRNTLSPTPLSPTGSTFSVETRMSANGDEQEGGHRVRRIKRRAFVDPIRTDIDVADMSAANSEANFSSDDELMDELQSAVFQEAKPVTVSKSPISPVFPSLDNSSDGKRSPRAVSNPVKKDNRDSQFLSPPTLLKSETWRSVSASSAPANHTNQQSTRPIAKKVNLGSGISQRIKALERLSNHAPEPTQTAPVAAATFFAVRKGSGSKTPSVADRASSLTRHTPSPPVSQESSPPKPLTLHSRSASAQNRMSAIVPSSNPMAQPTKSRPESVSVTARIVRDPSQPFPTKPDIGKNPSEFKPLELEQSPLVIDHQKAVVTALKENVKENVEERRLSNSSKSSKNGNSTDRRSSMTIVRDFIKEGRTSFSEHRRSMTIDTSISSSSDLTSRPPSTHANKNFGSSSSIKSRRSSRDMGHPPTTASSSSSTSDEKVDKKSNRASRMLRQMSSSISSSRKALAHAISPTVREESEPPSTQASQSQHSSQPSQSSLTPTITTIDIGDVNVQFPDTLLWKRRSMLLDSQGYLIMSPALPASGNPKDKRNVGATRRIHLSKFKAPIIPDVEMQELPNSVVLDFVEGGELQIACEDRGGQGRVLSSTFPSLLCLSQGSRN